MIPDYLNDLNEDQKRAVKHQGISLVFAGAGSGKTRALIYKLADILTRGFNSDEILALTFTNKAADEMKQRVFKLLNLRESTFTLPKSASGLFVGTFHSWGAKFLRREFSSNLTIYDEEDSLKLLKEILHELDYDLEPKFIRETISFAKNRLGNPTIFLNEGNSDKERKIAEIWQLYEKRKKDSRTFDFDDLLLRPLEMLLENSTLKEKYQYKYVLVDEFQDTNLPQYILIKFLSEKNQNLFVVGDDYQSIYKFRGSNYENILELEKDFPKVETFILGRNYRSTKKIVESANHLILNNKFQKHKNLWTNNKDGENINIIEAYNEEEEAEIISSIVFEMLSSCKPSEIAILYRVNFLSRALEEKFLIKNIPYKIYGGIHFYQRKEIKDILAYMRVLNNPRDLISLKRIINTPQRGIGSITQEKFFGLGIDIVEKLLFGVDVSRDRNMETRFSALKTKNRFQPIYEKIKNKEIKKFLKVYYELRLLTQEKPPLSEFIKNLVDVIGYLDYVKDDYDRILNISEFISVASRFNNIPFENAFQQFLELTSLWQAHDEIDSDKKIKLMTIHLSKGLEFKNVFVVGMEEEIFPHRKSINNDLFSDNGDIEEERRLAYVALTRAKEKIYLSYAKKRRYWGKYTDTIPSRFIGELPEKNIHHYTIP